MQNLIEKIAQRAAVNLEAGHEVHAGDYIYIRPSHVMTHDNTGAVIPKFLSIGATAVADPRQPVFALDHDIQNKDEKNLAKYQKIRDFAAANGIDFHPAGRGIGHQIMCEEGYAFPGEMMVASDSHSNMYGGLGCLGTPVVRTDAAAIWATGRTWWQVPPVARVTLHGAPRPGVTGKDVIITLCGFFNHDEVLNHAVEFAGDGLAFLSINNRLAIANMTTEWGALAGLFPVDAVTIAWYRDRHAFIARRGPEGVPSDADTPGGHPRINTERIDAIEREMLRPDPGAYYAKELSLDLSRIEPHVAGPNSVKMMTPVSRIRRDAVRIDKAYLVSCVNSRVEDLAEAAAAVRGKRVAPHVKMYIAAASSEVQAESERRGDWQALVDAGAIVLPPGCGPCIGLGTGLLEDGEVGISATNRNFKGRMGSPSAQAYLASPAVVAASAVAGVIDMPFDFESCDLQGSIDARPKPAATGAVVVIDGFPEVLRGRIIFCHQDNLNTDGIYPGKYTYNDDFTPQQQAQVAMENYDPSFNAMVEEGDFLAGGFNFGTGSSREQAATALKYRGIRLVVAGSFSETYKRNAINNGFLVIEAPELIRDLKEKFGAEMPSVLTGITAVLDMKHATIEAAGRVYHIDPVGPAAQELVLVGGLESWVRKRINN